MEDNKSRLTNSAVEKTLLKGLYLEPEASKLEEIQYHHAVSLFPENTRKQRIKAKLKKNPQIYGCWLKYKKFRDRKAAGTSMGMRIKSFLKKFRTMRYVSNKIHMPWKVRHNHEMLSTLTEIATAISQKCDAVCWQMDDLRKRVEKLEKQTAIIQQQHVGLETDLEELKFEHAKLLTDLHEKLDTTNNVLLTGVHEKLDTTNNVLLTGVHEKLDSANVTLAQTMAQLPACRTVVSTNEIVCVQYDWNLLVGVPASDWRLAMYLSLGGHFEYGTELLFRNTIKPNMIVLDIGANVGIYSLHALRCGAIVYSFEPTPSTFRALKQNTAINGFENSPNVNLYNAAVSDNTGTIRFAEVDGVCGQNNMFTVDEQGRYIEVQAVKLDDLLGNVKLDCFKLDVEGAEMLALHGMENLLKDNPEIIGFVEFAPPNLKRAQVNPRDFYDYLRDLGFTNIYHINEEDGSISAVSSYEEIENEVSINLYITKGGQK